MWQFRGGGSMNWLIVWKRIEKSLSEIEEDSVSLLRDTGRQFHWFGLTQSHCHYHFMSFARSNADTALFRELEQNRADYRRLKSQWSCCWIFWWLFSVFLQTVTVWGDWAWGWLYKTIPLTWSIIQYYKYVMYSDFM